MTLATQITIGRILMIPFFIGSLLYYDRSAEEGHPEEGFRWAAVGFFLVASLSDALDGFVARHWNQQSHLGAILDPLADKGLLLSGIITLSLIDVPGDVLLPIWFLVLVLARDTLLISGIGFLHLYIGEVKVAPHWTGKLTTFLQMAAVSLVLLQWWTWLTPYVIAAAGAATSISAVIYLFRGIRHISASEKSRPTSSG